jgi:hypothetical protein
MENQSKNPKKRASVLSPDGVRQAIGYLGIIMPAILMVGTLTIGNCSHLQDSISHYYFTIMGGFLVATLCAFAVILFIYQGYGLKDNLITSFAGLCALGIALFATTHIEDVDCMVCCLSDCKARIFTHYISAALFFITLSYISIFIFTKSDGVKTPEKIKRNRVYRTCGIVMLVSIFFIFLIRIIPWLGDNLKAIKPVFLLEWIALVAFGISWLVKGNTMFRDKPNK